MNFLLSSFLAVPVSSTLDFLSLPLRWVFFVSTSTAGAFAKLGSCCAWPPPGGGRAEVVSATLNQSHGTIDVRGVGNFLSSVSSQHKFEMMYIKALCLSQLSDRPFYSSRLSDRSCYSSRTDQCYSSVLFRK